MSKNIKTMDGNTAVAHIATKFSEVCGVYPITPSTVMAEVVDQLAAQGEKNLFGREVQTIEMQSEAGAAGTVHGALQAGALSSTFTASQGLLLMIPNMYKMAGEELPAVLHVSARTVASHALSIYGDHSDVMACRQTGFAMLASNSVQEAGDMAAITHLAAIKASMPFLHFFDGFRTSHEIQKIELPTDEVLDSLLDREALQRFRDKAMTPSNPDERGSAQDPEIFFQVREASNSNYDRIPGIVQEIMDGYGKATGREYNLVDYYGAEDATEVIVAMGSICDVVEETIDYLNANGRKTGLIKIRMYRPFPKEQFLAAVPATATNISVLDRTKEPGSIGEPLLEDVVMCYANADTKPYITGGRYGLSSKNTTPTHIVAVFDNMISEKRKDRFTVAIIDDVTNMSLKFDPTFNLGKHGEYSAKFWGLGSDGTVGANKNSIKIIGDNTEKNVQAYFVYDSKKSGGTTISHLRVSDHKIKSPFLVGHADFVAVHMPTYINKFNIAKDLKNNATLLINCSWTDEELIGRMPLEMKQIILDRNINVYVVDAFTAAREIGLGTRINTIMQAAFFKLLNMSELGNVQQLMKDAATKTFESKGEEIVKMNHDAIDYGFENMRTVTVTADDLKESTVVVNDAHKPEFVKNWIKTVDSREGDCLKVSEMMDVKDGSFMIGSAQFEKRNIATHTPCWIEGNCIQCNQCAYVCPHAVIRPFLLTDEEVANAPENTKHKDAAKPAHDLQYSLGISVADCTGCGACEAICPAKEKALTMETRESQEEQVEIFDYLVHLPEKENPYNAATVKGSQFAKPLFEFSGSCQGCGETSYARLITQLFGDRMHIANATGCSSIWGNSCPSTPFTTNDKGRGPSWANSLFEDNAEFGFGMKLATDYRRVNLIMAAHKLADAGNEAAATWLESKDDSKLTRIVSDALIEALQGDDSEEAKAILAEQHLLVKPSQWIWGGDGWAYDIGFGGLDHVISTNANVNIFIYDTEVYSNTGGQASKSTPIGAIAALAASGMKDNKKDLATMAMSYGHVYVAKIGMGANQAQTLKAIQEAEAHDGPSIIIAYAPCIAHGIKGGLVNTQAETKAAVEAGYWQLFRYNPNAEAGKKFVMDSKEPTGSYIDFIKNENRYTSLLRSNPEEAEKLFEEAGKKAKERHDFYIGLGKVLNKED